MDSSLPSSKSVPSNLILGRRHRVSISGSCSYQSHLSSLGGHLHRVRTTSEQISLNPINLEKDYLHILEDGLAQEPRPRVGRLFLLKQIVIDPATFLSDDLRRIRSGHVWSLRTLVTLYCCLCVLFFAIEIYTFSRQALGVARQPSDRPTPKLAQAPSVRASTPFINVTSTQRLSVAFRGLSPRARLDAFVVQAPLTSESDLTACLWIEDVGIDKALASAAAWSGPVSLVVVTTKTPHSPEYEHVLGRLVATHSANASVHVLYAPLVAGASSNAYLNMARFFARTSRVVLFPDGIPQSASHGWQDLPDVPHPVLVSNATHAGQGFSPRPLAPVVMPRDHPVWCTERFYLFGSRVLDWEDCVWKLWLESAGEAAIIPFVQGKNTTALSVSPFATKIRLRWSTRYRSEACAFTLKRSQALGFLSRTEKKHMQWKKKFCRETVGPGVALDSS